MNERELFQAKSLAADMTENERFLLYETKKYNAALLGFVSFLLPGVGQLLLGKVGRGVAFLVAWLLAGFLVVLVIGFVLLPIVQVWAAIDAYRSARRWNDLLFEAVVTRFGRREARGPETSPGAREVLEI